MNFDLIITICVIIFPVVGFIAFAFIKAYRITTITQKNSSHYFITKHKNHAPKHKDKDSIIAYEKFRKSANYSSYILDK